MGNEGSTLDISVSLDYNISITDFNELMKIK